MAAKNAIPTIDLSPLRGASGTERREVARQIDAACTEIGFFIVTGHGISQDLITTARQQAIDFFALPDEEKMKVQRPARQDQPRLQLGRRPVGCIFDGPGGAARHSRGLCIRARKRRRSGIAGRRR